MKKKATAIKIQIPAPCTQDFSKMHPLPGGRYCDHCERTVVDFRQMTDREIVRIYQQRQGRVCGIFKDSQLDRPLPLPQAPKEGKPWAAIAALSSALLFGNPANGQSTEQTPIHAANISSENKTPNFSGEKVTIEGWVTSDKGEPIPFATLSLADGSGEVTDFDGYFKMEVPLHLVGTEAKFSCLGYEKKSLIIDKTNAVGQPIEVELKSSIYTLNEVVVTYPRSPITHWAGGGMASAIYQTSSGNKEVEIKVDNRIQLTIYPNPFLSQLTIEMEVQTAQPYLFHLYTEAGQLVFAESRELEAGLQTLQLDLVQRHLPEGIYFLRISDDAGEIRTKRLVKVSP